MRSLPEGNYALSIAHPGHELRLHGFLDLKKPWVFILSDGGNPSHIDRMQHYLGFIFKNTGILKKERDAFYIIERKHNNLKEDNQSGYVKDEEIQNELMQGNAAWFEFYITKMANSLIKDKIDYVVADASEDMDSVHEISRIMTEIAIKLVKKKKGKEIKLYEFNVLKPFDHNISDDCIRIELSPEEQQNKLKYIIGYHDSIFSELSQNISIDQAVIKNYMGVPGGFEEIKKLIHEINPNFFKYEYIRSAQDIVHSEDYNTIFLPIKQKLEALILNPIMVKIN